MNAKMLIDPDVLMDLWQYFDQRADAGGGDDGRGINEEMRHRHEIEKCLERAGYRKCNAPACNCEILARARCCVAAWRKYKENGQ